ncbi:MAG: mechanosensitive ion channel family protein [Nanoarchaeota archaeon]|nr:mechanosensitive ion channel family protein [Nanoarchaeota archaeon]
MVNETLNNSVINGKAIIDTFWNSWPFIRTIITIIIAIVVFNIIIALIKKALLKKAKSKRQISNIQIFSKVLTIVFALIVVLIAVFTYAGSWGGLGLSLGLFSAALGWALQKPITGIAAWIMIVIRRPFEIGDRVIIGTVRGDVVNISLTHIYLKEIGGIVAGEENSGRTIMVPNSILFEQNIINYTLDNDYILGEVITTITYGSDIDEAIKLSKKAAEKITKEIIEKYNKEPYVRTYFQPSGMNIHLRFLAESRKLQETTSEVTQEIFRLIKKSKDVKIAYPHTEIVFKDRK